MAADTHRIRRFGRLAKVIDGHVFYDDAALRETHLRAAAEVAGADGPGVLAAVLNFLVIPADHGGQRTIDDAAALLARLRDDDNPSH